MTPNEPVFDYLRMRAGLSPASLRRSGAARAVSRLLSRLKLHDQRELVRRLGRDDKLFDSLIADVTVGETHFFRHKAQLEAIRKIVFPSLSKERSADHMYRIWSAGCATGEEAYTLAIMASEEGLARRTSILATDISRPALSRAEAAEYSAWSFRGMDRSFIRNYFETKGACARVRGDIRDLVRFRPLNLALDDYPSPGTATADLDLILCRNVLIYFDSNAVSQAARRLYECLAPGGWLVLGPSDPPLWHHVDLEPILAPGAVIYKREGRKALRARAAKSRHGAAPASSPPARPGRPAMDGKAAKDARPKRTVPNSRVAPKNEDIVQIARSDGVERAEQVAASRLAKDPLAVDLRYLRSVLLMSLNRDEEAIAELRRLVYIDRSNAAAHFALGTLFHKQGNDSRARRYFTNAYRSSASLPPDEQVPLAEGLTASRLASLARQHICDLSDRRASGE
jgi:chemotaxis protein methyltransferase CheR